MPATATKTSVIKFVGDQAELDESRLCHAQPGDVRGDPKHCTYANRLQEANPWMKHVSVTKKMIRAFDYRCKHNPEGLMGKCAVCPGRCLNWATPLSAVQVLDAFDKGGDPYFVPVTLRESEARIETIGQDKVKKRKAASKYRVEVKEGKRTVNHRSPRAKARAKSNRRKG